MVIEGYYYNLQISKSNVYNLQNQNISSSPVNREEENVLFPIITGTLALQFLYKALFIDKTVESE